jgi:hypothetical protein
VSLILEALKKLEREKGTPDRGFLVLAHLQGPAGYRRRSWAVAAGSLAILAVVAMGLGWWRLAAGRPQPAPALIPAAASAPPVPTAVVPAAVAAPTPRAVAPTRDASSRPAPPRAGATPSPEGAPPEFRLNAISQQDGVPVAIVNDRLVREGDSFDGVRVLRIGEAEVELEVRGVRRVLGF